MIHLFSGVGLVVEAGLAVFCFVDVLLSPEVAVRWLPRWAWALSVLVFPLVASVCWLVASAPYRAGVRGPQRLWTSATSPASAPASPTPPAAPARPERRRRRPERRAAGTSRELTPDDVLRAARLADDPAADTALVLQMFEVNAEHERTLTRWEADLRAREERLRRALVDPLVDPLADPLADPSREHPGSAAA